MTKSNLFIATANELTVGNKFNKSGKVISVDKNGKAPFILSPVTGRCPNKLVISGTVAENSGIENGKSYLMKFREMPRDEQFGRQFSISKVKEVSAVEIVESAAILGSVTILDTVEESVGEEAGVAGLSADAPKSRL